jgi:glycosyltransferase involved in cell wall biosynthesis
MRITVAIAVYNGAATLRATLDSVLSQTLEPIEILVVNDGSTDGTASILQQYASRLTVIEQSNRGLAASRNVLCQHARGDLIAFLDADDIWHPNYLRVQVDQFKRFPVAAALFTGHLNFYTTSDLHWDMRMLPDDAAAELIPSVEFIERYTRKTGPFASPSYCCVPRSILESLGRNPFDDRVRVCDDAYLFYLLAMTGPIAYTSTPLAGYRLTPGSLSSNRLRNLESGVHVFELLKDRLRTTNDVALRRAFRSAFAAKRREYAKALMGSKRFADARVQLHMASRCSKSVLSMCKTLGLLLTSYIPSTLQPEWPAEVIR